VPPECGSIDRRCGPVDRASTHNLANGVERDLNSRIGDHLRLARPASCLIPNVRDLKALTLLVLFLVAGPLACSVDSPVSPALTPSPSSASDASAAPSHAPDASEHAVDASGHAPTTDGGLPTQPPQDGGVVIHPHKRGI